MTATPTTPPAEGCIDTQVLDHVLLIGINRPAKRNGWTPPMFRQLAEAYTRLDDDPNLRVGVLHARQQPERLEGRAPAVHRLRRGELDGKRSERGGGLWHAPDLNLKTGAVPEGRSVPVPVQRGLLHQRGQLAAPDAQVAQLVLAHGGKVLRVGARAAAIHHAAAPAAQGMDQALMKGRWLQRVHDVLLGWVHSSSCGA